MSYLMEDWVEQGLLHALKNILITRSILSSAAFAAVMHECQIECLDPEGAQVLFKYGPQHFNFLGSKSISMLVAWHEISYILLDMFT